MENSELEEIKQAESGIPHNQEFVVNATSAARELMSDFSKEERKSWSKDPDAFFNALAPKVRERLGGNLTPEQEEDLSYALKEDLFEAIFIGM